MLFQRINRGDPEKIFLICRNDEASAAWIKGSGIAWQADGTRDGVDVVKLATAAKSSLLVGIADSAIAAGEYGLVQCYGLRTDAVINQSGTASNGNGAVGDIMVPWTASTGFSGAAAGAVTGFLPSIVLMQTVASSTALTTTTGSVFLRCM